MISPPAITQSAEQHTACIRLHIPRAQMMQAFGPAVAELVATLQAQGLVPQRAVFAHHLKITEEHFDFEVGFITDTPVQPAGRVKPGRWPAQKVARTVYQGPYQGLPAAWGEFTRWMLAQELAQADDLWEHYLTGPQSGTDPSNWQTELTRPLMR